MKIISQWSVISFGEVVETTQYGTSLKANESGAGIPVLRMNNITYSGTFDLTDLKHVELPPMEVEQYSVRRGDLLFNRTNSQQLVGKMGVWNRDEPYAFAGYLVRLRLKRTLADPGFIAAWFNTLDMKTLLRTRAKPSINMSNINATEVLKFPVVLPPLAEQQRIVEVLDRAEALRAQRRAALAQLDSLTQAIFLDLFGDPATNPKGWPRRSLKALGHVSTGGTPPSAEVGMFDGPIPFITPGDLDSDAPIKRSLTEAGAEKSVTVRPGSTLVCCIGATIGKSGKASVRSAFNQQINAIEWGSEVDDRYGLAVLRFFKPTIVAWGASTTLPILKKSAFERIEVPVPPHELQTEFSRRLQVVERFGGTYRESLARLDELFGTLQYRAFRGEL